MNHVVNQLELLAVICKELERQGHKRMTQRHMNACLRAANDIVSEFSIPERKVSPGMGISAWWASDGTGLSSRALAARLMREHEKTFGRKDYEKRAFAAFVEVLDSERTAHPHDPADLLRCVQMLDAEPGLSQYLQFAADLSPVWARIIAKWSPLEMSLRNEMAKGTSAPKTYEMLRALVEGKS